MKRLFTISFAIAMTGIATALLAAENIVVPGEYIGGTTAPKFSFLLQSSTLAVCEGDIRKVRVQVTRTDRTKPCDARSEWCSVKVAADCKASLILSGIKDVRAGKVETGRIQGSRYPSGRWTIEFRGHQYTVSYQELTDTKEGYLDYRVLVESGRKSLTLVAINHAFRGPESVMGDLLWAGDLNRDGFLDLLVDAPQNYCPGQYRLFLSTGKDLEFREIMQKEMGGCV